MATPRQDRSTTASSSACGKATESTVRPDAVLSGLVAGIQQRQAERERLLGLCQQLRQQHRCPGRCVLTGELDRDGLSVFRSMLDGRA